MGKYALYVKEISGKRKGKWSRLTKQGREFTSKIKAQGRRKYLLPMSHKKIGVRKVK